MTSPINITFIPILEFPRGTLFDLVSRSYAVIADDAMLEKFRQVDQDTFDNPETIAPCVTITCIDSSLVGLTAHDPRRFPRAIIGQNCVVPEHQHKGLGQAQLLHLLSELKAKGFTSAVATTMDTLFFASARRMYETCGFEKVATTNNTRQHLVEYEIQL